TGLPVVDGFRSGGGGCETGAPLGQTRSRRHVGLDPHGGRGRGWRFEVRSEPPPVRLENLRFLAGYRRDWLFDPVLLADLRAADLHGVRLGAAFGCLPGRPEPVVRSAALHLSWSGHLAA